MQQKPITISANEFNEKVKNNLRDYYVYQFKRFRKDDTSDYRKKGTNDSKPASTFTEEKQRLLAMLESQTQLEWTMEKGGVCCCTMDTRNLTHNPFWEPYRFCAAPPRYLGWFLSTALLLHPHIQLRDPLGLPEPLFPRALQPLHPQTTIRLKSMSQENLQSWLQRQVSNLYEDIYEEMTGDEDFCWGTFCIDRYLAVYRQRINCKKMILEQDPDRFGASGELLQRFYSHRVGSQDIGKDQFKNRLDSETTGMLRSKRLSQRKEQWYLSSNRLALPREQKDVCFRFAQMLGFFSQTMPLGFVGTCLQQRVGEDAGIFRYKHSYITKALNDYNIADLLHAIQQKAWIRLEYRNGAKLRYQYMVCFPLQIRESTQDGRQYLMYYHPGYRSLGALRLDFIDRIHYGTVEEQCYYAQDICNARQALQYVWGSSMPGFFTGNMMQPPKYTHIKMVVRKEFPVIENRLRREARHGQVTQVDEIAKTVTYEVDIADPLEMIPWIRSFAPRVLEIWVDGNPCFPQETDPTTVMRAYISESAAQLAAKPDRHESREDVVFRPQKDIRYPHDRLFNPLFSVSFDVVLRVLFTMMQQPDRTFTHRLLNELILQAWPPEIPLQDDMQDLIYENITMLCSGSPQRGYRLDYIPTKEYRDSCTTPWDMLPLSDLEASYLKGILQQPKARLFLSSAEIAVLLSGLEEKTQALDFSGVFYHDQYCDITPYYILDSTRGNFSALLTSAAQSTVIDAVYTSQRETAPCQLTAVYLEYSKREDKFWACCADSGQRISFRNLERFVSAQVTEAVTDPCLLKELASKNATANRRKLVLSFLDEKNRAERLVTEFSPWNKKCTCFFEADAKCYTLELFYDDQDTFEIAVRLLSYGEGMHILEDSGHVAQQIALRRTLPASIG